MRIPIQHIFYSPEPIGNGTSTGEMCEWLAKRDHEVTFRPADREHGENGADIRSSCIPYS
jgi:hypothetical protein